VNAVDEEVRRLDGVTDVEIDLASGTVSVTSVEVLGSAAMADAVADAGYELVGL
jgi:copper chaperone